jgi:hypothetical protein
MNAHPGITKRRRYLGAMRGDTTDGELVWAPNFDYWLSINRAQGTLPEAYREMSRNDIVRAVNGTLWNRSWGLSWECDPSVKHTHGTREDGVRFHEITTPLGSVREESSPTESAHSTHARTRHFITDLDSLRVMTYAVEASRPVVDFEPAAKALEETGQDGVVLLGAGCVPFIQFAKTDAGYMNAFYLMADHPVETERLVAAYHKNFVGAVKLLAPSPADVIAFGDNMDELMMSPDLFERYAVGFYQECKAALAGSGKIMEAHWCGRTRRLLPLLPKTGMDVVEAVVTEPMADVTLAHALDLLDGKVVLQGGVPAVMVCPDVVSQRDFETYFETVVLPQKGRPGFILGMSDNVPPNADFSRVEQVARLVAR